MSSSTTTGIDVTLIVALVAAIAAIVAPLVSAFITQHGTYKVKFSEIYFSTQVDAYSALINAIKRVQVNLNDLDDAYNELRIASARVYVFVSEETLSKLATYNVCVVSISVSRATGIIESTDGIAKAEAELLASLRKDIQQYNPQKNKSS